MVPHPFRKETDMKRKKLKVTRTQLKEYQGYLKSPLWARIRKSILERDNRQCQLCGSRENPEVHHIRYPKNFEFGTEPGEDLITLCHNCHRKVHDKNDPDRKYLIAVLKARRHYMRHMAEKGKKMAEVEIDPDQKKKIWLQQTFQIAGVIRRSDIIFQPNGNGKKASVTGMITTKEQLDQIENEYFATHPQADRQIGWDREEVEHELELAHRAFILRLIYLKGRTPDAAARQVHVEESVVKNIIEKQNEPIPIKPLTHFFHI